MRAESCADHLANLRYPLWASGKIDGIRALSVEIDGVVTATSRSGKPLPNRFIQSRFRGLPPGLDGELVIPKHSFTPATTDPRTWAPFYGKNGIESVVMSRDHDLGMLVSYQVFDVWNEWKPFRERIEAVKHHASNTAPWVHEVDQTVVCDTETLRAWDIRNIHVGFEGTCLRDPSAFYKHGKSTLREQALLKLKQFVDDEATIIGYVELENNTNLPRRDELGFTRRSSAAAGQLLGNMLGSLRVYHRTFGEFEIGTGFSEADRIDLWSRRETLRGRLVTFKYQPHGTMDKPRSPVFKWFRNEIDL